MVIGGAEEERARRRLDASGDGFVPPSGNVVGTQGFGHRRREFPNIPGGKSSPIQRETETPTKELSNRSEEDGKGKDRSLRLRAFAVLSAFSIFPPKNPFESWGQWEQLSSVCESTCGN